MRTSAPEALCEVLAWWVLLLALNLVFISTVSVLEVAVAAGSAVIAAVAARGVRIAAAGAPGTGGPWAAAVLMWPRAVLADTWRLAVATARSLFGNPVHGRFHTVELTPGTGAGWACGMLSATPGTYAVDVREGQAGSGDIVTVHVLGDSVTALERVLTHGGRR